MSNNLIYTHSSLPPSLFFSTCPLSSIHLFNCFWCFAVPSIYFCVCVLFFLLHWLLSLSTIQVSAIYQAASLFHLLLFISFLYFSLFSTDPSCLSSSCCPSLPVSFVCLNFIHHVYLSFSLLSLAILSLAVPLLSYLLVYLCVCVCTDNSLAGSIHRYWRPLRATLFILSRSSSTTAQEEGLQPATVCVNRRERERNEWKAQLFVCVFVVHVCVEWTVTNRAE